MQNKNKNRNRPEPQELETVALENVLGGCACGANCACGASCICPPTGAAQPQQRQRWS